MLDATKNPSFKGWIRLDNIWYTVNSRSRRTYVMQKFQKGVTDTDANVEDPNQYLSPYVQPATTAEPDEGRSYSALINQDYLYVYRTEYKEYAPIFRAVQPFEEERLADNAPNTYTADIYCPENTFSAPMDNGILEKLKASTRVWRMLTHVSIMAKFTPKVLQVEYGFFDFIANDQSNYFQEEDKQAIAKLCPTTGDHTDTDVVKVECPSEQIAGDILTASLIRYNMYKKDGGTDAFPADTYFYHEKEATDTGCPYYTYGAAHLKYNAFDPAWPKRLGNYVPHLTGYGYYYTYIDNRHEEKKSEAFTFYRHGQVERNRYYILTTNSFSNPSSSIVNPDYIEVNTRTKDWLSGGSGTIGLK